MSEINFNFSIIPQQNGGHKVKAGETLYSIAKSMGVSVEELKKANGLKDNTISIGLKSTVSLIANLVSRNSYDARYIG